MDQQKLTLLVLLDLNAAFGTFSHKILTDTLESEFDVIGNALKLTESFSSRRKRRIKIKHEFPTQYTLNCGARRKLSWTNSLGYSRYSLLGYK